MHLIEDLADLQVHAGNHGRVDGHFHSLETFLFLSEGGPGNGARDFARADRGDQFLVRRVPARPHIRFERRERAVDQAHTAHAREFPLPSGVPALRETILVLLDILR